MPKPFRAYLDLTLAMAIVGSSVVVGKLVLASFPIFLASGLRFGLASLLLVPLLLYHERRLPRPSRADLRILALQSFTGIFLFNVLLLYGLKYTSATAGGVITSTTPAVIGLLSWLFLGERLRWNTVAGIILAVLGIMAINLLGGGAQGGGAACVLGSLLIFGAVVGEACFTIFGKLLVSRFSPLAIATYVSLLGFLMFLPLAVRDAAQFDFATLPPAAWLPIIYYGVVVTVVAFILWYSGVAAVPASTAAVFTGVLPISTILLSHLLLGERLGWGHLAGIACVLIAIRLSAGPIARTRQGAAPAERRAA